MITRTDSAVDILLIEDSPEDAELTQYALRKAGISNPIVHIADGAVALDYIFGTAEHPPFDSHSRPRVILLDLKLPKIDGREILRQLKSSSLTETIPVVVLTSSKLDPDIQICYELGANSYIVKPVGFENFSKAVAEIGMYWLLLNKAP